MANFIEITLENDKKELVNTSAIETVYLHEGHTIVTYSAYSRSGAISARIKEKYEDIKALLLK